MLSMRSLASLLAVVATHAMPDDVMVLMQHRTVQPPPPPPPAEMKASEPPPPPVMEEAEPQAEPQAYPVMDDVAADAPPPPPPVLQVPNVPPPPFVLGVPAPPANTEKIPDDLPPLPPAADAAVNANLIPPLPPPPPARKAAAVPNEGKGPPPAMSLPAPLYLPSEKFVPHAFPPGDHALIRLEQGNLSGLAVPVEIRSRKPNGRYHVRVNTAPISRDLFNVPEESLLKTKKYKETLWRLQLQPTLANNAVNQLEKEVGDRTRAEALDRNMTVAQMQQYVALLRATMEREVIAEARKTGCPSGFKEHEGHGRYLDFLANSTTETAAVCGEACKRRAGSACQSFQWSPTKKTCIMATPAAPYFKKDYKDFMFCGRG